MDVNFDLALDRYVIEEDFGTVRISLWSGYRMDSLQRGKEVKMAMPYKQAKELKALIKYLLNREKEKILKTRTNS